MASSPKLISILFLFAFFSMQIHAREFFSKIPRVNTNEKETTAVPETQKVSEKEPSFLPETQNGYGLYGHESGQLPPSTTTTTTKKEPYEPYVTPVRYHPDEPYNSIPATKTKTNNNYKNTYGTEEKNLGEARFTERGWETKENNNYKNNAYETEEKNLNGARFTERGWETKESNNGYKNTYGTEEKNLGEARFTERGWETKESNNGYKNTYGTEEKNLGEARFTERGWETKENNDYKNKNNYYNNNVEKQGMSDTRFLENGKYYHDINNENNYYPSQFENSKTEFNENRYNNKNMGRYNQNQEEFEESEEEFEP